MSLDMFVCNVLTFGGVGWERLKSLNERQRVEPFPHVEGIIQHHSDLEHCGWSCSVSIFKVELWGLQI